MTEKNKKVLVVEDDEISFLVLSEYLKQNNYKVARAINGEEAVSLVKNRGETYSLILMDILMPVMNGFEAAEKIKKINKELKIIAQTAVSFEWSDELDFSSFDHLMIKPLDFQKLGEIISMAVIKKNIPDLLEFQTN